jgi:hypothetical protein
VEEAIQVYEMASPRQRPPDLTLYARVGKGDVALYRWPTTIGGWKTIEKSDGSMALKYKESVTGDAIWPEILATPTYGTAAYRSVKRGESNGCHRMHNYVVLRMAGFLVKHRENVRDGLVPEDYVRHLE